MEDILRWGTQDLFQARRDSEDSQRAGPSGGPGPPAALANGSTDAAMRDSTGNAELDHSASVNLKASLIMPHE